MEANKRKENIMNKSKLDLKEVDLEKLKEVAGGNKTDISDIKNDTKKGTVSSSFLPDKMHAT